MADIRKSEEVVLTFMGTRRHKGKTIYVIFRHLCKRKYIYNRAFDTEECCNRVLEAIKAKGVDEKTFFRSRGLPLKVHYYEDGVHYLLDNSKNYGYYRD